MIKGQSIFLAGGCGFIGQSIFKKLILEEAKIMVFDKNKKIIDKLKKKYSSNKNIIFMYGDILSVNDLDQAIKKCLKNFSSIDSAINCTLPNVKQRKVFSKIDKRYLNNEFQNHLTSSIIFSKTILKYFLKNKKGNLLNFSSIYGIKAPKFEYYKNTKMINPIEYGVIKAGIIYMTKYLSSYCKKTNIRINCISPGGIFNDQPKSFLNKYKNDSLIKGMLNGDDITGTVLFLISPSSEYIKGQNIIIDDGWSL